MSKTWPFCAWALVIVVCCVSHVMCQWRPMGRFGKRTDDPFNFFDRPLNTIHTDEDTLIPDTRTDNHDVTLGGDVIHTRPHIVTVDGRTCVRYPSSGKIKCLRYDDTNAGEMVK